MSDGRRFGTDASRGLVLVSLLLVLALLGLSTGASLWVTRAELWAVGRARSETQALYTAEAGIRHGLAVLAPDVDWQALFGREPEALSSTSSPGPWPIAGGGAVPFPGPPFGYELEVESSTEPAPGAPLLLRARATAVRGVELDVRASIRRSHTPYAPAAVVLDGGELRVEGAAVGLPTAPRVEIDGGDVGAALGAPSTDEARSAEEEAARGGVHLDGGVLAAVRGFDVPRFARRSGLDEEAAAALGTARGARGAPVASRVRGGSAPALLGVGVLVSSGDLEVAGDVDFAGVVLVGGRLRLGAGTCRISGMLWARSIEFAGPCRVRLEADAVEEADRALRLPRLPVLAALERGG